jgi:hypothetical protein
LNWSCYCGSSVKSPQVSAANAACIIYAPFADVEFNRLRAMLHREGLFASAQYSGYFVAAYTFNRIFESRILKRNLKLRLLP